MAEAKPLISIIVPFYNIEGCVRYCMKSLLKQTYRDYEIVCIDDGSTDSTGKLLDEYGELINVSVHHKENGGLSEARNYGVSVARGELVTFVDGDDVISPYYLEVLEKSYRINGSGIAVGQICYVGDKEARDGTIEWEKPSSGHSIAKKDLIDKYAYEEVLPSGCCRLAAIDLYRIRPFPAGKYYEEIYTAAGYVADADSASFVTTPIYGYVMRQGSIVHRKEARFKQVEDYLDAISEFREAACWTKGDGAQTYFECLSYSRIYRLLEAVVDARKEKITMQRGISKLIKANLPILLNDKRISKGNKARFVILGTVPRVYCRSFNAFEQLRQTKGKLTRRRR